MHKNLQGIDLKLKIQFSRCCILDSNRFKIIIKSNEIIFYNINPRSLKITG